MKTFYRVAGVVLISFFYSAVPKRRTYKQARIVGVAPVLSGNRIRIADKIIKRDGNGMPTTSMNS